MMNHIAASGTKLTAVLLTASLLSTDVLFIGCKSIKNNTNKTQRGAGIGAGGGAVIGGVIGRRSGNTVLGAILGATVGGAAGAVIGRRMDKQAEEIKKDLPEAKVERVGEGIKVTLGSDILFDVNSATLKPATQKALDDFAASLNKYDDTNILVEGHADATGPDDYNLKLSKQRADAVAGYLESKAVKSSRVDEKGYGETQPVADNTTEAGRAQNRRVDVAVFANKKLVKAAKKGEAGQ